MRLPKTLSRQIEARAKPEGLNKTEWARNAIRELVTKEAERQFQKIHDEVISDLTMLRDEATIQAYIRNQEKEGCAS